MSSGIEIFNNSELAMAAYANLNYNYATDDEDNIDALVEAGMSEEQAIQFAARYPTVVAVIPDTENGFSGTVFRDADGQLTVALRGTAGAGDLLQDVGLTIHGAAYSQIVDMYNWWQKETAANGQTIYEYKIEWSSTEPAGSVLKMSGTREGSGAHPQTEFQWLIRSEVVTNKEGALYGQADINSVNVTGHSLGGHLASAFTALFSNQVDQAFTYNGPGFKNTEANQEFFAMLENVASGNAIMPSTVAEKVTRVQANDATPGEDQIEAISNLHGGTPGELVQVAIEDRGFWAGDLGTGNHSIVNLTDSLALYGLLAKLDPALKVETFNTIFHTASNSMESTRENFLDSLELLITADPTALPIGEDFRNEFYTALYTLQSQPLFNSPTGITVKSSMDINGTQAATDFSAFLSLYHLSPIYLAGASTHLNTSANSTLYNQWSSGKYSGHYLGDRANALHLLLASHTSDEHDTFPDSDNTVYYDYETGTAIFNGGSYAFIEPANNADRAQVHFGSQVTDTLTGGNKNDCLYGGMGNDTYIFDMATDNETIGADIIGDADGGILQLQGINLGTLKPIFSDSNIYQDDNNPDIQVILSASTSGYTLRIIRAETREVITIEGFNKTNNNFGLNFSNEEIPANPDFSNSYTAGNGLLGQWDQDDDDPQTNTDIYFDRKRADSLTVLDYTGEDEQILRKKTLYEASYGNIENSIIYDAGTFFNNGITVAEFEGGNGNDLLQGKNQSGGGYDILSGLDGDDVIISEGKNKANTTSGDDADILIGGRGHDQLFGGGGNDWLYGTERIYTGSSASIGLDYDTDEYSSIAEALYKGAIENIENENDSNYLVGGLGSDNLEGGSFNDTLIGGAGDGDYLVAGAGQDILSGGAGADTLFGDSYLRKDPTTNILLADFIAPDVMPSSGDYTRAYFYKDKNSSPELRYHNDLHKNDKSAYNALFNDALDGGDGNDNIYGELGSDIINGGAGSDTLFGDRMYNSGAVLPEIPEEQFQKLSFQYHGNDVIDGGANNDKIIGGGGDDLLFGGDEAVSGTSINDIIYGDLGIGVFDKPKIGTSEQKISASQDEWWGDDIIFGGNGNNVLAGEAGNDAVYGGDNIDNIYGDWHKAAQGIGIEDYDNYGGEDFLSGGAGNDIIYGGAGNDTLTGGTGADYLYGESGDDTFIIYGGDGTDVVDDISGDNTLNLLGTWLNNGKIVVNQTSGLVHLYTTEDKTNFIQISNATWNTLWNRIKDSMGNILTAESEASLANNQTSTMTLLKGIIYSINTPENSNSGIKTSNASDISFANNNRINAFMENGSARLEITTKSGDIINLKVSNWNELSEIKDYDNKTAGFNINVSDNLSDGYEITGKDGNDVITGGDASEVIHGKSGIDRLYGGDGNDYLYGDQGTVDDGVGGDYLFGEEGNDHLYGTDKNDDLYGGSGNDVMDGGAGNDRFLFIAGDGNDTISNSDNNDIIQLDSDPENTYVSREGDDWLIRYKDSNDSIRIIGTTGVNRIRFSASDTLWLLDNSISLGTDRIHTISLTASESAGADDVSVFFHPDTLLNNDGSLLADGWHVIDFRVLSGIDDPEQFYYGEFLGGNKIMAFRVQTAGAATLQYFVQHDSGGPIYAQIIDVNFDNLSDSLLEGTNKNDYLDAMDAAVTIMDGNEGDDVIIGGMGADTVLHRVGDGNDVLQMYEGGGIHDQLILVGDGTLDPANVQFQQDVYSLKICSGTETITVDDFFHDSTVWGPIWTRYGELGSIKFFNNESTYQSWLLDPSGNPPTAEWTLADLLENERELAADYRELWLHQPGEALVAKPQTDAGLVANSTFWAETPDPEAEAVDSGLTGVGVDALTDSYLDPARTAFFFDNSRAYP